MPRVKRKSDKQRAKENKRRYRSKKEAEKSNAAQILDDAVSVGSVGSEERALGRKITADVDGAERSGEVIADKVLGIATNVTHRTDDICDRLQNVALQTPHPAAVSASNSLPEEIAENLTLVQAIINSELGEASLRELLNPLGWLDAQTIYLYLQAIASAAATRVIIVQPYIWMLRIANAEVVAPYRYVRHYIDNFIDDWEVVLVPIILPNHHVMGVYRRSNRIFEYFDSLLKPISDETRAAIAGMLDVLHPGVAYTFVNSRDVVRQVDGSSCGVIACFTALQVLTGRPTNDVAFDSNRFRLEIFNAITAPPVQREDAAPQSTARTRATKRRGESVISDTPKSVAIKKNPRRSVAIDSGTTSVPKKNRFRAARSELPPSFYVGKMEKACPKCAALHFDKEAFLCCSGGRVKVPLITQPKLMKDLYGGLHRHSKSFLNNVRNINSLFAMASLTANEEHIAGGMQVYKISGELYVNVSALYERGPRPSFGNYYHYEVDEANNLRQNTERGAQVERDLLVEIDHVLRENNVFCKLYMRFHEVYQDAVRAYRQEGRDGEPQIRMRIMNVSERVTSEEGDVHRGRLNPATPGQVMAVFDAKDEGVPPDPRQRGTWVYPRRIRSPRPLPHWSADAFPLLFPMLLPYGQHFYTRGIPVAISEGRKGPKRADAADDDEDTDDNGEMDRGSKSRKFVTQREFALYHYAYRATDNPHRLWAARRLAQQFVVYNHVCIESERLQWISDTCRSMRCDEASDLFRKVVDENFAKKGWKIGKVVILPASYPGSPRNMQRCFEDSIALVADVGRPNYFITFTTNPNWPEIKGMLRVGERCVDQPMLVARVFHQYFSEFLNDLLKKEVLGKVVGFAYNTEFQKRGLPHVHLLLCVDRSDQVLTPEDIDDVIQAYIPPLPAEGEEDAKGKMELRRLVLSHMIHRPCRIGNFPCRTKEGLCSKGFPKAYNEHTSLAANGYALLKRPNDGTAELLEDGKTVVTNRDVVPYSRYFLKKFHTHINIEHCASIECVKYIFKYVFKGYDCAIMQMMTKRNREAITEDVDVRVGADNNNPAAEPPREADGAVNFRQQRIDDVADDNNLDAAAANEQEEDAAENNIVGVQVHFDDLPEEARNDGPMEIAGEVVDYDEVSWARRMRVVTAPEAVYRDCGYLMHRISHAIVRLNFHLPGEKNVYFLEGKEAAALERSRTRRSQLEAFFELNTTDPTARQYTYLDIPKHFRWDEKNCRWVRRLRKKKILSRIYTVKARFVEKFCLRMLLKYVKGPRSFEDVRTVNGHTYPSFFDACVALGLSVADTVWEDSLAEVCAYRMPRQARQCFAAMISFGAIQDAPRLWQLFKAQMVDRDSHRSTEELERRALRHIQRILNAAAQDLRSYGIQFEDSSESNDNEDLGRNSPSAADERMQVERMYAELNVGQREVVDRILDAIYKTNPASTSTQRYFFLQGAGGTGKTHVYNLIIRLLRLRGDATIAVAFTGIAATLLINGTTVHSRFRLPFQVLHDSVSTIKADSDEAETIRNAKLIVWDEACTQKRYALEAVERLLRDIAVGAQKSVPFGGHVMLLGGDWRQMLPIVEDGSNDDAVAVTIRNSELWPLFEVLRLTQNMRTGRGEQVFASFLERLGNGELQDRETGDARKRLASWALRKTEDAYMYKKLAPSA